MSANPKREHWTVAEYLALEQQSDHKHEFIDGEVRAMVGASRTHNVIASSITGLLYTQLAKRPCEHYQGDMRVRLHAEKGYVYPDVTVVCDAPHFVEGQFDTLTNPTVIFEVLSPSTATYDRGEKSVYYRAIPTVQHYVLVGQDAPQVEVYTRRSQTEWLYQEITGLASVILLPAIDCTLALTDIYAKVSFDAPAQNTEEA